MTVRLGLAMVLTLGFAALTPHPSAAADPMDDTFVPLITDPDWAKKPNGNDVAGFYPETAQIKHQGGGAVIVCRVLKNGGLEDCTVIIESPEGFDFGNAARRMALRKFKMKPLTVAGKPFSGGVVVIPIFFLPPGLQGAPRIDYMAGDASVLMTPEPEGSKSTIPCPTQTNASQRCAAHLFYWDDRPNMTDVEKILDQAGSLSGVSQINCKGGPAGALTDCKLLGENGPSAQAAVAALIPTFKLPAKANDGSVVGDNRVAITFDWQHIRTIIEKVDAARRRQ